MTLTIDSGIQSQLDSGHAAWVPLIRADFGHGRYRRWSTTQIGPKHSFDGETYEPRTDEIPELSFGGDEGTGELTIRVENVTGYGVNLIDSGFRLHRARISICVLYPDLAKAVGDWTAPYWQGSVTGYELDEEWLELKCEPGFIELGRQHPRLGHSCLNNFADGLWCDYDPLAGKGVPERRFTGSATGGGATTLVDGGADFSTVQPGWLVFNVADKCIGSVTQVATTTLTVDDFINGTANAFVSGDGYIVGPPFTSCPKSKTGCIERGMFALDTTGKVDRRWFRGLSDPARVPFLTRAYNSRGKPSRFFNVSQASDSLDATPWPMVFGVFRNRDMIRLGVAVEDETEEDPFISALWLASVGRCFFASRLDIDGYPIDDVDRRGHLEGTATGGSDTTLVDSSKDFVDIGVEAKMLVFNLTDGSVGLITGVATTTITCDSGFRHGTANAYVSGDSYLITNANQADSLVLFGFQSSGSNDQSAVTAAEITQEQQRLGIAAREARAYVRATDLDSHLQNPYLFADESGDGVSWSNASLIRTRHQPTGVNREPRASANIIGAWCRMPPGASAQTDNGNFTDWTYLPNPVQVAYHYLRYYHGIPDSRLSQDLFNTASDHCQEKIDSTQTHLANVSGTVLYGPDDAGTSTAIRNFFVTENQLSVSFTGGAVTVNTSGGPVTRTIASLFPVRAEMINPEPDIGGGPFMPPSPGPTTLFWKVQVTEDFPADHVPAAGDSFTIFAAGSVGATIRRYKFNGMIDLAKPAHEVVRAILDNCNGKLIYKGGKLGVVIPAITDLDALPSAKIFTDKGSSRTIVRERRGNSWKSTAKWKADEWEEVSNEIAVSFANREKDYEHDERRVYNERSQLFLAEAFGESTGRDKQEKSLSLNGTSTLDQALRLAALKLREQGPWPGNRANGTLTFEVSIHDYQTLVPWEDVHLVETDVLPSYLRGRPFRLTEIEPNLDKMTAKTTWRPHTNAWYDDSTEDVGVEDLPETSRFQPDAPPLKTEIESLTDLGFVTGDGTFAERVRVEWTNPT